MVFDDGVLPSSGIHNSISNFTKCFVYSNNERKVIHNAAQREIYYDESNLIYIEFLETIYYYLILMKCIRNKL